MHRLTFIKQDWTALTYCKIKGHVISKDVIRSLKEDGGWIETQCKKCHYPVFVRVDPENASYYLTSEEV